MATGIGQGLSALANSIFLETPSNSTTPQLSTFGGLIVVFAGIALARVCWLMARLNRVKSVKVLILIPS